MTRRHNSARIDHTRVARIAYRLYEAVKHAESTLQRVRIRWLWPVCCGGKPRSWRYEEER